LGVAEAARIREADTAEAVMTEAGEQQRVSVGARRGWRKGGC